MSKIISLANIKGGVGKSTIAINLAGYLATNATVLLIDADPQGTVTDWDMVRHKNSKIQNNNISILETIEPFNDENFIKSVEINSKGKEFVIIDCPPEAKKIMRTVLVISDYTIIPVTPSPFDIRSANKTVQIIKKGLETKATKVKSRMLISKKIVGTALGKQAKESLEFLDIPVFKTEISQRVVLCEAGIEGYTIFEYEFQSKASQEFIKLGKEVEKWLSQN